MTDIDTAAIRAEFEKAKADIAARSSFATGAMLLVAGNVPALVAEVEQQRDALAAANATIERVREIAYGRYSGRYVNAAAQLDAILAALSDAPVSDAAEPEPNVDRCPEWNCPDLSTEDRINGKRCAQHPCTCSDAARPSPLVEITDEMVEAARVGIRERLRFPSLHWGAEGLHPDALPHIARAALTAALSPRVESTPDENGERR